MALAFPADGGGSEKSKRGKRKREKIKSLIIKKISKCFGESNNIHFSYYFLKYLQILLRRPSLGGQAWQGGTKQGAISQTDSLALSCVIG